VWPLKEHFTLYEYAMYEYVDMYTSMYSSRLMELVNCVNCDLWFYVSYAATYIYTRGIGNTCFSYMWREYMIILQHVMLHVVQYVVECKVH